MSKDRYVKVDRKGCLAAEDRDLQRWLVKRAGKWRVIPTPQTMMIFERIGDLDDKAAKRAKDDAHLSSKKASEKSAPEKGDAQAASPHDGRVVFTGMVTARGQLTDVINMLHSGRWEGTFHVLTGGVRKTLMIKAGDVVGAVSTALSDRLGELLCSHGIITHEQLDQTVKEAGGPQRLGAVLISKKLLTPHQLYSYLNLQVKEIFYSLLFLDEGQYYFKNRELDDPAWRQLRLNTSSLMLDGMRRVDEMQFFRERIPSSKIIFEQGELQELTLEEADHQILDQIDGQKDLVQIAQNAHLTEHDATKVAYRLLQAGIIRPRSENFLGRRGQAANDAGLLDVLHLANKVLSQLAKEAAQVGRERELQQAPAAFHASDTSYNRLFDGVSLQPDGSLATSVIIGNLGAIKARAPTEFLYQAINEFLSFAVFVVVDGLGVEREQAIRRKLDELLEAVK